MVERLAKRTPLAEAVDTTDPSAWTTLDAGVRAAAVCRMDLLPTRAWTEERWYAVGLPGMFRRAEHAVEAKLALALCHPHRWVREAAIRRAGAYPALLPLVVLRATDWADPVREPARELLRERLGPDTAAALTPLILRVGRRYRGSYGVELLTEVLRRAPRERIVPLFTDPDRAVRRFAYRLAVEEGRLSPAELATAAARDHDGIVQDLCAEAALAGVREGAAYDDVLGPLLRARNPRVRSAGVTALRRSGRPEQAEGFLADRSGLVRACARYVVRQHATDPLPWYRRRCATPDDPALPPGAAIGLAECGERTDAELLWPLLGHPSPSVRARAVAGLRALDLRDVRRLWPLLDDPAPGVVREATAALLPSARSLDADWLAERLESGRPRHVRVSAYRLLDAHGGVVRLRTAVALLDDPDLKLRTWATQSVQGWHATADVPRGAAEVGELLDRARHLFSEYALKRRKWGAGLDA
ncbi:HEAT repeat domain-containing protein [Streptomyces luteolifulvus]|jgi:hypothetical protein|nr:HEAT repeat domain-containing protein [Streptomyces luteolifulvus]